MVRDICERFIRTTYIRDLFYRWMLVAVQKVIQDLVADVQRTVPGYQVDANNAQVIQAPALSYGHRGRVTKIWQMIPKVKFYLSILGP